MNTAKKVMPNLTNALTRSKIIYNTITEAYRIFCIKAHHQCANLTCTHWTSFASSMITSL